MTRLIIPALCLLVCAIGCSTSDTSDASGPEASFEPVGTWTYDRAATAADSGNAGHEEEIKDIENADITMVLSDDGTATVSENNLPDEASYTVDDNSVTISAENEMTLTFTFKGGYLTIPNPKSDSGLPVFYFSKQP